MNARVIDKKWQMAEGRKTGLDRTTNHKREGGPWRERGGWIAGLVRKRDAAGKVVWMVRMYHERRDRTFGSFLTKTEAREF